MWFLSSLVAVKTVWKTFSLQLSIVDTRSVFLHELVKRYMIEKNRMLFLFAFVKRIFQTFLWLVVHLGFYAWLLCIFMDFRIYKLNSQWRNSKWRIPINFNMAEFIMVDLLSSKIFLKSNQSLSVSHVTNIPIFSAFKHVLYLVKIGI